MVEGEDENNLDGEVKDAQDTFSPVDSLTSHVLKVILLLHLAQVRRTGSSHFSD